MIAHTISQKSSPTPSSTTATAEPTANPEQKISLLSPYIEMGVVELNVKNLETQTAFYQNLAGLEVMEETAQQVTLGYQQRAIIRLISRPDLPLPGINDAGLYHIAIVYESRTTLAQAIQKILQEQPALFSGTSDHVVSEAFYFNDPEMNGIELYFDKNPNTWIWKDGKVIMGGIYIDPIEYIQKYANAAATPAKKMGHVHLKIGNIETAQQFYGDILGFTITAQMPTALFLSNGTYHHHLGMNVWESEGAGKREETLGLKSYELILPDQKYIDELVKRLEKNTIEFSNQGNTLTLYDPWNNQIHISIQPQMFE